MFLVSRSSIISFCLFAACFDGGVVASTTTQDRVQELLALAREAQKEGLVSKSITNYQKVIGLCPTDADAWLELGNMWYQKRDFQEALHAYRKALELRPDSPSIHHNIGLCLRKCDNDQEAISYFESAIKLRPGYALSYINYYQLLKKQGKEKEAFALLQQGIAAAPNDALLNNTIGVCYREQNQFEKAVEHFRRAVRKDPNNLIYMQELANTLSMINQYDEALLLYQKIFEMDTSLVSILYNIGYILKRQGHMNEAIQVYQKVLELSPDHGQAHFALGMAYLARNASDTDWLQGWQEYEWRWTAYQETKKQFGDKPLWQGEDLAGKSIMVLAEQGYGDTFQFIRYAKVLKERGAKVIFLCQTALKNYLPVACDYIDQIVSAGDPIPAFDYQIHLMSLPFVLKTTEKTLPADIPYLKADAHLVQYWKERLSADKNIKIGLCWHGNANYSTQALRQVVAAKSVEVKELLAAVSKVPGCSFYSLQKMGGEEQLNELTGLCIHDFGYELDREHGRFMDTAAIMVNLDLIITVDTSIAHLAAALGVPTWILLPTPSDWRWMMNRLDTPWYPKVRLFRQPAMGDWAGLLGAVQEALQEIVVGPAEKIPQVEIVHEHTDSCDKCTACANDSGDLLQAPVAEFLDQLTLIASKNGSLFPPQASCVPGQEELLKRYQLKVEQHPELQALTYGLYAANCYLIAAMNELYTDTSAMNGSEVEEQIADLNRAQKLKRLLKNKISQIVQ